MKDFAHTYEQHKWERAAESYARMQHWLKTVTTPSMLEYAKKRIKELEEQYPQLLK